MTMQQVRNDNATRLPLSSLSTPSIFASSPTLLSENKKTENFSTLRKLVLQLLEKETSCSQGIAFKQWKAALSTGYIEKVIGL
jgi:hypothetical protein